MDITIVETSSVEVDGKTVEAIPARIADGPVECAAGYLVAPTAVTEAEGGIPVRIFDGAVGEDSLGRQVDTWPMSGIFH